MIRILFKAFKTRKFIICRKLNIKVKREGEKKKKKNLPISNKGHDEGRIVANGNQRCEWELESSRSLPMGVIENGIVANGFGVGIVANGVAIVAKCYNFFFIISDEIHISSLKLYF